jgi:hypothetical protein
LRELKIRLIVEEYERDNGFDYMHYTYPHKAVRLTQREFTYAPTDPLNPAFDRLKWELKRELYDRGWYYNEGNQEGLWPDDAEGNFDGAGKAERQGRQEG